MQIGEKDFTSKFNLTRALSEADKIALICGQHFKIGQFQSRIKELTCAHESGQCVLCCDKDQTIAELSEKVKTLQTQLFGKSSERRKKFRVKPGKKNEGSDHSTSGSDDQKKTRVRLPSEQYPAAKITEQNVEDKDPPLCTDCSLAMTDSGLRETSERLELIPMDIFIVRMLRTRYHCKPCQSAPQTATLPARIAPHSSLNDSVLIESSLAKFYDLIPTERFAKMLRRSSGVDISDKLVWSAQKILAQAFLPIYEALKKEVLESELLHADESPHRMLERNEGHHSWFLWSFCTKSSVYFEIHETRSGDVSIEFIKNSQALYLMSDVYSGYGRTVREVNLDRESRGQPLLISAHCNDHARRYFFKVGEQPDATKILDVYGEIYAIEAEVQKLIATPTFEEPENTDKALSLRQNMDPLFNKIYDFSAEILMNHAGDSAIGVAAKYFLNNLTGLTRFMGDLRIPIHNAPAERSVRNPAVGRKTWYGTHSRRGAEVTAILFSIFESCRLMEVDPRKYCWDQAKRLHNGDSLQTPNQYKYIPDSKPPPNL